MDALAAEIVKAAIDSNDFVIHESKNHDVFDLSGFKARLDDLFLRLESLR